MADLNKTWMDTKLQNHEGYTRKSKHAHKKKGLNHVCQFGNNKLMNLEKKLRKTHVSSTRMASNDMQNLSSNTQGCNALLFCKCT